MPKLYGISEIAEVLGQRRETVSQWRKRGKLPAATHVLATGPVWEAQDIEPWIREQQERRGT